MMLTFHLGLDSDNVNWRAYVYIRQRSFGPKVVKTWRHPQNRKYITYNTTRGKPIHGHRQHAQKFGSVRSCGFRVMRVNRETNRQTNRQTHRSTSHPFRGGRWGRK